MKTQDFRIYTRAVILNSNRDKILLIKKKAHQKLGGGEWLLPGGTVEFNEDVELSLVREIREETDLLVEYVQLLTVKRMVIEDTHWIGIYYLAIVVDEEKLMNVEENKHETVKFVPYDEVPDFRDYTILQFIRGIDSNCEYFNIAPVTPKDHAMGDALFEYLHMKIHNFIRINSDLFTRIRVIGNYNRNSHVSKSEKNDKLFNFKRPTALIDGDVLYLCCFPGKDYLYHYSKLVSTYLFLLNKPKAVSYILPSSQAILKTFLETNIKDIPPCDVIIFGNVDKIDLFKEKAFEGDGDFMWKQGVLHGKKAVLLGCKFSVWGDTGYNFIGILSEVATFGTFVYIGKLGSLDPHVKPNEHIATGSKSRLPNGEVVIWDNVFKDSIRGTNALTGDHVTCPSVLDELKKEIPNLQKYGIFIDPEIGHMANACAKNDKRFSYLHIISDNIAQHREENLSNERSASVRDKRVELYKEIGTILHKTEF